MKKDIYKVVKSLQKNIDDKVHQELVWMSLTTGRLYDSIEDELCQINFFRRYKDLVCQMSDDECLDIYKGVILLFGRHQEKPLRIKCLFEDLFDWHRLDFANKRVAFVLKNMDDTQFKKAIILSYLYDGNYFTMMRDYKYLRDQGLL